MNTRTCPLCQGKDYFLAARDSFATITLGGWFKMISVHPLICLDCGFVAPSLDQSELLSVRHTVSRLTDKSRPE